MQRITLTLTPVTQAQAAMARAGAAVEIVMRPALSVSCALVPPQQQISLEVCTAIKGPKGDKGDTGTPEDVPDMTLIFDNNLI